MHEVLITLSWNKTTTTLRQKWTFISSTLQKSTVIKITTKIPWLQKELVLGSSLSHSKSSWGSLILFTECDGVCSVLLSSTLPRNPQWVVHSVRICWVYSLWWVLRGASMHKVISIVWWFPFYVIDKSLLFLWNVWPLDESEWQDYPEFTSVVSYPKFWLFHSVLFSPDLSSTSH